MSNLNFNNQLVISSSFVGIGTTTPSYIFDVFQTDVKAVIRATGEGQSSTLFLGTGFNSSAQPKTAIIAQGISNWSRANLHFCLNTNQGSNTIAASLSDSKMVILNGGNVGIGTTTAGSRLQVRGSGTTTSTNALGVENSSGTNLLTITDGQVSTFGRKSTFTFGPTALYVGNGPFNFETSIVLDAFSGDNVNYKTIIYSGYSYVNPFRITSNNRDIIYAFEGGVAVQVPDVLTQGVRVWNTLETQGSYHHIHSPFGSWPSGIKLTNPSTNTGSTDGVYMGLWTSGIDARLWNYETTGRWDIGVGNVTQATVTTSSVTINSVLTLTPQNPLPTSGVPTGSFAVSSSTPPKPYFWDGASWNALY
jgi:hypothetical protein